ncbi:hypothetical protein NW756_005642 [Fusarium oxysporum]|nr:hypothetical protein NW763_013512 [Fusarium oxysporum]KAJ4041342.1 hypothetical protein NW753_010752 [Fusarium oxysporum]KAJ4091442.1 hypothetical protein NW756_005642 [Fusarium oxysporum]KAJ4092625.1 hypothetical protein NW769_012619 [Fusarium oxysporum]KAJ4220165.1 hypothetical protein NW760_012084 [Fusarium oxysporum]
MPEAEEYTIGWICALTKELIAAKVFLDFLHDPVDNAAINDDNNYTLGSIGKHNVVIAVLPYGQYGLVNATAALKDMTRTFSNLRAVLMVGIGGGVPCENDIRLGDIVVGSVGPSSGGVIQYDYGRAIQGEEFAVTGHLNQPPMAFLTAMSALHARYEMEGHSIDINIDRALQRYKRLGKKYKRPEASTDRLYESNFVHQGSKGIRCSELCGNDNLVHRAERGEDENNPAIHCGLIASGNQLVKNALLRDKLAAKHGILCFEMEAAGLMNHFPCVLIRGICDYSDSHKNDEWQEYAAMAAAAYTKDLLLQVAPSSVQKEERIETLLGRLNEKVDDIHQVTTESSRDIKSLSSSVRDDAISRWLNSTDPSVDHNKAREACHPGTGHWLLTNPQYLTWKSQNNSFLWLNGNSGTGKTILTSTVIEDIRNSPLPQLRNYAILYFYITFTDSQKQCLDAILRSLINQLYHSRQETRHPITSLRSKCGGGSSRATVEQLKSTFREMLSVGGEVFILIDALDEYQNRSTQRDDLLSWIESFHNEPVNTHLLVTSRPEDDIKTSIKTWADSDSIIFLTPDNVGRDISDYVYDVVIKSTSFRRWHGQTSTQNDIVNSLTAKSDGVFRWVALQLERLKDCINIEEVKTTLDTLPETLQETYYRVLNELASTRRRYVIRILQLLAYSDLPMKLEAAVDTIAIDLTAPPGSRFIMNDQICLVYILEMNCSLSNEELLSTHPFLPFAMESWVHDASCRRPRFNTFTHLSMELFSNHLLFKRWRGLIEDRTSIENPFPGFRCPPKHDQLYYASWSGDKNCVKRLLDASATGDTTAWRLDPALHVASEFGHLDIVALLIQEGADVNANAGSISNALCAAIEAGHTDVISLLIKEGADVNARQWPSTYITPLEAASKSGCLDIVELLIQQGANVNAKSKYTNALCSACESGHLSIVMHLVEKGAEVNAQTGNGTALQAASASGYLDIVIFLLEEGAEVDSQGDHGTALCMASFTGHLRVVKYLVEKGADVNGPGWFFENALQAAMHFQRDSVVEFLQSHKADFRHQEDDHASLYLKSS